MSSTQTTLPAISYPLSFQSTGASLPSCFTRRPLFSIACSLFSENTRVGVPQQISPLESTTSSLFFPPLFARQLPQLSILPFVRVSAPPRQSIYCPFVFILLQIPFPGNLFFSHPYKTPGGGGHGAEIVRMSPVASLERVYGTGSAGEGLLFFGGLYEEHDERAASGGDAQDAEE